jgi:hypothetical protein
MRETVYRLGTCVRPDPTKPRQFKSVGAPRLVAGEEAADDAPMALLVYLRGWDVVRGRSVARVPASEPR